MEHALSARRIRYWLRDREGGVCAGVVDITYTRPTQYVVSVLALVLFCTLYKPRSMCWSLFLQLCLRRIYYRWRGSRIAIDAPAKEFCGLLLSLFNLNMGNGCLIMWRGKSRQPPPPLPQSVSGFQQSMHLTVCSRPWWAD